MFLVLPDEVASRLSWEKIRLVMKLEDSGYPELKNVTQAIPEQR